MKKIIILTILCFTFSATMFAQGNCDICGTWSGMHKHLGNNPPLDVKITVRISKHNNAYQIRVKHYYIKSGETYYEKCTITSANDHYISWYDTDYDYDDKESCTINRYHSVVYSDGMLSFSLLQTIIDCKGVGYNKDSHVEFAGEKWQRNISLFRDETDW